MESFNHDCNIRVYIYTFMYVHLEMIPEEESSPYNKIFVEKYKKTSTPGPEPKHFELYPKFDETEMKRIKIKR